MPDWWLLAADALWIGGLALLLSTLSLRYYVAASPPSHFAARRIGSLSRIGLCLFSLGMCARSSHLLAALAWGAVFLLGVLEALTAGRQRSP